jgi:predicted nucleic acid-binding protein
MGIQGTSAATRMKLIITDTNVFFDIINIGALPEFFSLDLEICTTAFVNAEIKQPRQREMVDAFIRSKKLTVYNFSAEEIEDVQNFETTKSLKRFTDQSVIWKSLQIQCPMLTGDKKMRDIAEKMGIEVHGSLWVINELISKELITDEKALTLIEELKKTNDWLPKNEIEKMVILLKRRINGKL